MPRLKNLRGERGLARWSLYTVGLPQSYQVVMNDGGQRGTDVPPRGYSYIHIIVARLLVAGCGRKRSKRRGTEET